MRSLPCLHTLSHVVGFFFPEEVKNPPARDDKIEEGSQWAVLLALKQESRVGFVDIHPTMYVVSP